MTHPTPRPDTASGRRIEDRLRDYMASPTRDHDFDRDHMLREALSTIRELRERVTGWEERYVDDYWYTESIALRARLSSTERVVEAAWRCERDPSFLDRLDGVGFGNLRRALIGLNDALAALDQSVTPTGGDGR